MLSCDPGPAERILPKLTLEDGPKDCLVVVAIAGVACVAGLVLGDERLVGGAGRLGFLGPVERGGLVADLAVEGVHVGVDLLPRLGLLAAELSRFLGRSVEQILRLFPGGEPAVD